MGFDRGNVGNGLLRFETPLTKFAFGWALSTPPKRPIKSISARRLSWRRKRLGLLRFTSDYGVQLVVSPYFVLAKDGPIFA
ncbi:hypothetical protein HYC85_005996 [Camellia sinensis]|uniref:Uncharacterized protein n=1 Tax=Camellia sinensis TaxID=4442 RepID=A0A7J7I2K1_CAMSI|nr:hypothetical protein HYC85_005996 [Camellia sinensis]